MISLGAQTAAPFPPLLQNPIPDRRWWLTPVILATQETDQEDHGSKPAGANILQQSIWKKTITIKGLVEWLKVIALSSSPTTTKKKISIPYYIYIYACVYVSVTCVCMFIYVAYHRFISLYTYSLLISLFCYHFLCSSMASFKSLELFLTCS
jgi:hypothetical protein